MSVAFAVDGESHLLEAQTDIRGQWHCTHSLADQTLDQLRDAPTREWTRAHAGFLDQAFEVSSALKVALDRLVDDEIAQTLGIHTGCLYTDIKEFYDYLCPVKTLKAALDLGFPAPIAVLSFSAYGGVRILQGADGCSYPLQAARGITTGDKNSNNFARAALYNLLQVAYSRYTMVQTREWVDDLDCLCSECCARQDSRYRPKPRLLPRTEAFPHVWRRNRTSGFPVHSAMSAADLGIDRGFAARRRIPKHTRRWKSALVRARKICRLARNQTSARTTRMLAVTGMHPSATYSSKLLGMAPRNWIAFGQPQSTHSCHAREVDAAQLRWPLPWERASLESQLVSSSSDRG